MLPNISGLDLGNPTVPGEYSFRDAVVRVDGFHITAWRQAPKTAFNAILCTRLGDQGLRFALGQTAKTVR